MKKVEKEMEDELRPEYDLKNLRVRKLGPGRKSFGEVVRLEPDVAEVFPDADSVNEALRFLIRIARENEPPLLDRLSENREANPEQTKFEGPIYENINVVTPRKI